MSTNESLNRLQKHIKLYKSIFIASSLSDLRRQNSLKWTPELRQRFKLDTV